LLLINYSYHLLSGSELNPLSSFSVPLQGIHSSAPQSKATKAW
jgi:hypothetical protein